MTSQAKAREAKTENKWRPLGRALARGVSAGTIMPNGGKNLQSVETDCKDDSDTEQ